MIRLLQVNCTSPQGPSLDGAGAGAPGFRFDDRNSAAASSPRSWTPRATTIRAPPIAFTPAGRTRRGGQELLVRGPKLSAGRRETGGAAQDGLGRPPVRWKRRSPRWASTGPATAAIAWVFKVAGETSAGAMKPRLSLTEISDMLTALKHLATYLEQMNSSFGPRLLGMARWNLAWTDAQGDLGDLHRAGRRTGRSARSASRFIAAEPGLPPLSA